MTPTDGTPTKDPTSAKCVGLIYAVLVMGQLLVNIAPNVR